MRVPGRHGVAQLINGQGEEESGRAQQHRERVPAVAVGKVLHFLHCVPQQVQEAHGDEHCGREDDKTESVTTRVHTAAWLHGPAPCPQAH